MSASKEAITNQHAPVMLITSWRVMEKLAEVLKITVSVETSRQSYKLS